MPLPTNVKLNLAKEWTLEWCLFKSPILSDLFKDSVAEVHSRTEEFKKMQLRINTQNRLRRS